MLELIGEQVGTNITLDPKGILRRDNMLPAWNRKKKVYIEQDLKYDWGGAPPFVDTMMTQCPAINKLQRQIEKKDVLQFFGNHLPGLYMSTLFWYGNKRIAHEDGKQGVYFDAMQNYLEQFRVYDWSKHNWDRDTPTNDWVPRCQTWEEELDSCRGCPHKGVITNPTQLWWNKPLELNKIKKIASGSSLEIAKEVWKDANSRIDNAIKRDSELTLFVKSPQETYKTTNLCRKAARLAGDGLNVLVLVPTGRLAFEMYKRLLAMGKAPFLVMSHKNLFKYFAELGLINFKCPAAKEIQNMQDLGISRQVISREFCNGCKYRKECPFPKQYVNAVETSKNIVIAQHAHARARLAIRALLRKEFDILLIDETFISSMFHHLKVTAGEIEVMRRFKSKVSWMRGFIRWFQREQVPSGRIIIKDKLRSNLKKAFDYYDQPWHLLDYVEAYNQGLPYQPKIGVLNFYPWPDIPRKVFTDATAPVKLSAKLLDIKTRHVTVIGQDKLVNVKLYNPANEVIKVIDASNSVTAMSDAYRLEKILHFIGFKSQTQFKNKQSLVTVYADQIPQVVKFFREYYPKESKNIIVANMAVGTNEWRDVTVQYILAGVHLNTLTVKQEAWKYRQGVNYWRGKKGFDPVDNQYPHLIEPDDNNWTRRKKVRLNLLIDKQAWLVECPDFYTLHPKEIYESQADDIALGVSAQADRLRHHNDELKVSYRFSSRYQRGILYTRVCLEENLFSEAGLMKDDYA